jgi:hypothetical protein
MNLQESLIWQFLIALSLSPIPHCAKAAAKSEREKPCRDGWRGWAILVEALASLSLNWWRRMNRR